MTTTGEQMRKWSGPTILSFGFRPFFLLGSLWAVFAMIMWVLMLSGFEPLLTRFDPVSWHAHEFLFGYLGAIMAGFMLTAVPNWTGRLPIIGWPLGGLVVLWLSGRVAIAFSELMTQSLVAALDLAFPIIFGGLILREIIAGKNWRNLFVIGIFATFSLADFLFHLESAQGVYAAQGIGLRLGLASAILITCLVAGRIIPSFTRNWLVKTGSDLRPVPPMQTFDKVVLLISLISLIIWTFWPNQKATGIILFVFGACHIARLLRWAGRHTFAEPLVWVLHVGYAFIPLGGLSVGLNILLPQTLVLAAPLHLWMAGAIGVMTLAVMTRATLGHTGHNLHAGPKTLGIYLAIIGSIAIRFTAGAFPDLAMVFYSLAAVLWIGAFAGFALVYGPLLLNSKPLGVR